MSDKPVFIWCHGGCFGGGKPSYDFSIRKKLSKKYRVIAADFPLDDYTNAVKFVKMCVDEYKAVGIGGISSGAFIAHHIANVCNIPAVLIAPVFNPYDRHGLLSDKDAKLQLKFFQSMEEMQKMQEMVFAPNTTLRYIIYGTQDKRATDVSLYQHWDNIILCDVPMNHAEICKNFPIELLNEV